MDMVSPELLEPYFNACPSILKLLSGQDFGNLVTFFDGRLEFGFRC